jgi:hypothetical protein
MNYGTTPTSQHPENNSFYALNWDTIVQREPKFNFFFETATFFQFQDDDILAAGGESSSSAPTLLGRFEDGRIIISRGGEHVTTVAMVPTTILF